MLLGSRARAFTFPEALVTMGTMLFFVILVGGILFQGRSWTGKMDERSKAVQEKVSLASILPSLCEQVRPPEWVAQDQAFQGHTNALEALYYEADPKKSVELVVDNGVLTIHTPQGRWSWKSLNSVSVDWWKSSERIIGVVVAWKEGQDEKKVHLPWGGTPL